MLNIASLPSEQEVALKGRNKREDYAS